MKRICIIITALALVMGFAQCKKSNDTAPDTEGVRISLVVDDGSKADVNPGNGTVTFKNGDVIYVGSGGNYVGTLTRTSGVFSGNITDPVEGQPLYFYFLGNVTPTINNNVFTVSIIDQTASLPVISCGTSKVNYSSSVSSYSAVLMNKCALAKFNVTSSSSSATCILGFNNKLTISLSNNTFTPSQDGNGVIRLASGNGEKWAILLPQDAIGEGSAYALDGSYKGTHDAVPVIAENGYLTMGIEVIVSTSNNYVDLGLPSGILWATHNVGAHVPEEYGDYFAWGETCPKDYYGWSTYQYCNGSSNTITKYCNNSEYGNDGYTDNLNILLPEDDAAAVNWGNGWRIATEEEWQELYQNTTVSDVYQNGVRGELFTASNGNSIFLPASGLRTANELRACGSDGLYWSSSLDLDHPIEALANHFNYSGFGLYWSQGRQVGQSVRPVRSDALSFIINASANPTESGGVSGGGSYQQGAECTLTATANEGYVFTNWTENDEVVSTSANYTFSVNANRTLVANFTLQNYTISVSASPSSGGSVSGGGSYNYGQSCTVHAIANTGYVFSNWTENGSVVSTNANYIFTVNANRTLVANFIIDTPPTGAISGKYTINASGNQVYFSQGNLQYQASTDTWRFAENQWDYVREDNANISQTYSGWIDLFGWGTSGWDNGNVYYHPWDSQSNGNGNQGYGYGPTNGSSYTFDLTGNYANADWGVYNAISNGGNQVGLWRTLTKDEWGYVFDTRTTASGIRYAKAFVNSKEGVILLPDDWSTDYYSLSSTNTSGASYYSNTINSSQWNTLEQHGAVFLPAAVNRDGTMPQNAERGYYWSASCNNENCYVAHLVYFYAGGLIPDNGNYRRYGCSVRLVHDVE